MLFLCMYLIFFTNVNMTSVLQQRMCFGWEYVNNEIVNAQSNIRKMESPEQGNILIET